MDILYFIKHYSHVLSGLNYLAMLAGVVLLLPVKGRWREYLIAIYGGFLFGMIPCWYLTENMVIALPACMLLSALFVFVQHCYGKKISLPFVILLFQMMLISGVLIWENAYSRNPVGFYLTFMLLSVVISGGVHLLTDLTTEKWSRTICPIFGIVMIAGAVLHFYRMDYDYFEKDLLTGESVPFFLHFLGIDYGIYDYQDLFFFLLVGLLAAYGLVIGVFHCFQKQRRSG